VARGLRLRGIDVTTCTDVNLVGTDDPVQLDYALKEGRVLFTQDEDFLRLHAAGMPHAGIVYCKPGTRSIGQIIQYLHLMSDCLEPDDMQGQIEYL